MRIYVIILCVLLAGSVSAEPFRMEQERLWLDVKNETLADVLSRFSNAGVEVWVDPAASKTISGSWAGRDLEDVLNEILNPYDYLLSWEKSSGPLGSLVRLTGIRVYRKGHVEAARLLDRGARRIAVSPDGTFRYMMNELLIGFGPDASMDDLRALLCNFGGTVSALLPELGIYRIRFPEGTNVLQMLETLKRNSAITRAEPNYAYDLPELFPGEAIAPSVLPLWNAPAGESPIAVAVLDSGLAPGVGLDRAILSAFDATHPNAPLNADAVGHGTKMAMLAAGLIDPYGRTLNEGVPVVAIKAFADDGSADGYTLMQSMVYAVQNSDGPVSLSWGSETPSAFLEAAINYAVSEDTIIFAAPGNENTGKPVYPAAYPNVIGVAASDGDQYAKYSNCGDFVDIVAPGSADFPGGSSSGTSIATAYASHITAKYMRKHPGESAAEVANALAKAVAPENGFLNEAAVNRLLAD